MKLEKQVCNLELAKKLKELGVKQKSLFWWIWINNKPQYKPRIAEKGQFSGYEEDEKCSAFTVAELGEMLPINITIDEHTCSFNIARAESGIGDKWQVEYTHWDNQRELLGKDAFTEADARAKMLIYLIENKLYGI